VVHERAGLEDVDSALTALEVVAGGIVRRLPPAEAKDLISQLPSELHEALFDLPAGPDRNVTRASVEADLAARLSLEQDSAAKLARSVGRALTALVSRGEVEQVSSQLPREMRDLLPTTVRHPTS
jgi:uncharacterized protein (DUF2267 family)